MCSCVRKGGVGSRVRRSRVDMRDPMRQGLRSGGAEAAWAVSSAKGMKLRRVMPKVRKELPQRASMRRDGTEPMRPGL